MCCTYIFIIFRWLIKWLIKITSVVGVEDTSQTVFDSLYTICDSIIMEIQQTSEFTKGKTEAFQNVIAAAHCICKGASYTTRNPSGHRNHSTTVPSVVCKAKIKKRRTEKCVVKCTVPKIQCLHNYSECHFQMVNLVILEQLGKRQRTQGFIKKYLLH